MARWLVGLANVPPALSKSGLVATRLGILVNHSCVDIGTWAYLITCVAEIFDKSLFKVFEIACEDGHTLSRSLQPLVGLRCHVEVALLSAKRALVVFKSLAWVMLQHVAAGTRYLVIRALLKIALAVVL